MSVHGMVEGDELRDQLWLEVRRALIESWDPIGVSDEPLAADEYDSYIPGVKALLRARVKIEVWIDYLDDVASSRTGFTPQRERGQTAAERLSALGKA